MTMKISIEKEINHKGTDCIYNDMFCQEGYCNECQIAIDFIKIQAEVINKYGRINRTRKDEIGSTTSES